MMSMTSDNNLQIFFLLLRSAMYGRPIPDSQLPREIPWDEIIAIAGRQAVYGLIIDSVQYLPEELRPPKSVADKMNRFALSLLRSNTLFDKAAAKLVREYKKHGIKGVLLKGQGVARYYRYPQIRQCGDIDFYVGKRQYKKAVEVSREFADENSGRGETEQHYTFYLDGVPVELHRLASHVDTPIRKGRYQRWVEEELEGCGRRRTLQLDDTPVALPSYGFDAIYIFFHAWGHYIMTGIGLRQLCDWTMLLYKHFDDINKGLLMRSLRSFGLLPGWRLFGCIAVEYLGLDKERMPLYDPKYSRRAAEAMEDILEGGNFGHHSRHNVGKPTPDQGLRYGVSKIAPLIRSYVNLITLSPIEATFVFLHRACYGTRSLLRRIIKN